MALLAPPKITSASPVISDGSRCRHCGLPMGWPRPVGLVFGDGTAAHHGCDAQAEAVLRCGHKHRHAWDPQHSETSPHANS